MSRRLLFTLFILQVLTQWATGQSLPVVNFLSPDSICTGSMVNITNLTTGGSTYYWNFCSGNTSYNPSGVNIGNPGNVLNPPVYISLAKDGNTCYSFITVQAAQAVVRYNHGSSFNNYPISWTNYVNPTMLSDSIEGVKVKYDNGNWYVFICNNNKLTRLDFGNSLANTPTWTQVGPFPVLLMSHCIEILREGSDWVAFVTNTTGNKLARLDFGNSLSNTPSSVNLGTVGGMNMPAAFSMVNENNSWYMIVANFGNKTLTRLTFGPSLFNLPTGENLGTVVSPINMCGITLIHDCNVTNGFLANYVPIGTATNMLYRLNFPNGIAGPVTGTGLGNIGNLDRPGHFSEIFRQNDSLFVYVTNLSYSSPSLTRLFFPSCANSSIPSSSLYTPPPFSYNQPGTYNINLIVNEGTSTQVQLCKDIVVGPSPVVSLGDDRSICPGTTTTIDAGAGFSGYLWSTGATTRTITVGNAGNYWVRVSKSGCYDYDTIGISVYPPVSLNIGQDTTVCVGQSYTFDAGACAGCMYIWSNLTAGLPNIGTGPTYTTGTPATYMVTKTSAYYCSKKDTATLFTAPAPIMTLFPLSSAICSGNTTNIVLTANQPGTTFTWVASLLSGAITGFSNGSGSVISQTLFNTGLIPGTIRYTITPHLGNCDGSPVNYTMTVNPTPILTNLPLSDSICTGSAINIVLQASISGSTFTWTATGSSTYLSGFSSGSGPVIAQTITNSGSAPAVVTYQIIPSALGCYGPSSDYLVYVKPAPDLSVTPDSLSICSDAQTNVGLSSNVTGTIFSWVATGSSAQVSGFSPGSGNLISQTLENSGSSVESVIYAISAQAAGCPGSVDTALVRVLPVPNVAASPSSLSLCSGEEAVMALSSSVSPVSFSWTASGSSPTLSGFSDGTGDTVRQQLFNSAFAIDTVTYIVTSSTNGCPGDTTSCIVSVKPIPAVSFSPATLFICSGTTTHIGITSPVPGSSFSWDCTSSSANISGFHADSGTVISDLLLNSGYSVESVTYHVSVVANGCSGTTSDYPVTVFPLPDLITIPGLSTICSGNFSDITLQSHVAATIFSWTAGSVSPLITGYSDGAGDLIHQQLFNAGTLPGTVNYAVTPYSNGCTGPDSSAVVTVETKPIVTFPICFDTITTLTAKPILLKGGNPPGGSYSGPGVNTLAGTFSPATAGPGSSLITYQYTKVNGCSNSAARTIKVVSSPGFTCGNNMTDIRNGKIYPTVMLAGKCWLAKNLDYGTAIVSSQSQRDNCQVEKYCYEDNASNCLLSGGLYQWDELMNYQDAAGSQGLCPPGWHVPDEPEWQSLFNLYVNNAFAGKPLLYTGYSGFNALIPGMEFFNRSSDFHGFATFLWTSTPHGGMKAWAHGMNSFNYGVSFYPSFRANAFSVRCTRD